MVIEKSKRCEPQLLVFHVTNKVSPSFTLCAIIRLVEKQKKKGGKKQRSDWGGSILMGAVDQFFLDFLQEGYKEAKIWK